MSKRVTYYLKRPVRLIMEIKKLFYIFFIVVISLNLSANVLYDKNELIITDIDVDIYKQLYKNNYGLDINNSNSLKDLILIKNVIKDLSVNNIEFIDKIDKQILLQYGNKSLENPNLKEFLRFAKIRDEFIFNYFQNKLNITEIKSLFESLDDLNLPISDNNCLIINDVIDLKNNEDFIKNLFYNLKNNSNEFKISINEKNYTVCIDELKFRSIEGLIVKYIQNQTKDEFTEFVYGKTKN